MWRDEWFTQLTTTSKLLFVYLLTNEFVGLTGYFEITDRQICFDTGLTQAQLANSKKELANKISFKNNWVYVKNLTKYDPIRGENNTLHKTYEAELSRVPEEIIRGIDAPSMVHEGTMHGRNGNGIGNGIGNSFGKSENLFLKNKPQRLTDEQFEKICSDYNVPPAFVLSKWDDLENYCLSKGKTYKDYYRALRDWVKRDAVKLKQGGGYGKRLVVVE